MRAQWPLRHVPAHAMAQIADILAKALDSAADPFLPIQLLKNPGQDFVSDLVGHNLYLWV